MRFSVKTATMSIPTVVTDTTNTIDDLSVIATSNTTGYLNTSIRSAILNVSTPLMSTMQYPSSSTPRRAKPSSRRRTMGSSNTMQEDNGVMFVPEKSPSDEDSMMMTKPLNQTPRSRIEVSSIKQKLDFKRYGHDSVLSIQGINESQVLTSTKIHDSSLKATSSKKNKFLRRCSERFGSLRKLNLSLNSSGSEVRKNKKCDEDLSIDWSDVLTSTKAENDMVFSNVNAMDEEDIDTTINPGRSHRKRCKKHRKINNDIVQRLDFEQVDNMATSLQDLTQCDANDNMGPRSSTRINMHDDDISINHTISTINDTTHIELDTTISNHESAFITAFDSLNESTILELQNTLRWQSTNSDESSSNCSCSSCNDSTDVMMEELGQRPPAVGQEQRKDDNSLVFKNQSATSDFTVFLSSPLCKISIAAGKQATSSSKKKLMQRFKKLSNLINNKNCKSLQIVNLHAA